MESISAFEIIKVGIGPSSSHTMGPWKAAELFIDEIKQSQPLANISQINVHLYGSLAKTGHGHGTDVAVLMGLAGEDYTQINTDTIPEKVNAIKSSKTILLGGVHTISFDYDKNLVFEYEQTLPFHANGMEFIAIFNTGELLSKNIIQ